MDPLVISVTVAGDTFSLAGLTDSTLVTSHGVAGTFFYLSAISGPHDEIDFSLQGTAPFLANANRSGSTRFSFSAPANSERGVGEAVFNDANTGPGSGAILEFSINDASARRTHTVRAPEIDTASAASGLTVLLLSNCALSGQRYAVVAEAPSTE